MKINTRSKDSIIASINEIAEDMILNKAIQINDSVFSIVDLEAYYWHGLHQDEYANGVKHKKQIGELEAHRYGIDISLGNSKEAGLGGLLISGIYDHNEKRVIQNPMLWRTLFNQLILGNNKIKIISYANRWTEVFKSTRINLGNADTDNKKEFVDSAYKYLAKDSDIFVGYKGKEVIFKTSNLTNKEIAKLLGNNFIKSRK